MVRLEVKRFNASALLSSKFQFLYGTIGRIQIALAEADVYTFQFLYGTIGSIRVKLSAVSIYTFQFLYGTIGSNITN